MNELPSKKATGRDLQARATKKKLYDCGIRLMNQYGYEHISVEQIAKTAQVSVGAFYHYFRSKMDLLAEIYRGGDDYFRAEVPALRSRYVSCCERVPAYFDLYARLSLLNGIDMVKSLYVPTNGMFLTHGRAMQDLLTDILREGQARGEVSAQCGAVEITEQLFLVARGVIFDWCLHDGKSDLAETMRDILVRQFQTYLSD